MYGVARTLAPLRCCERWRSDASFIASSKRSDSMPLRAIATRTFANGEGGDPHHSPFAVVGGPSADLLTSFKVALSHERAVTAVELPQTVRFSLDLGAAELDLAVVVILDVLRPQGASILGAAG